MGTEIGDLGWEASGASDLTVMILTCPECATSYFVDDLADLAEGADREVLELRRALDGAAGGRGCARAPAHAGSAAPARAAAASRGRRTGGGGPWKPSRRR